MGKRVIRRGWKATAKEKLSSRKLWVTVALILPMVASLFGAYEDAAVKIAAIITALIGGSVYNVVQGRIDAQKHDETEDEEL